VVSARWAGSWTRKPFLEGCTGLQRVEALDWMDSLVVALDCLSITQTTAQH
jgi:hypothetical protein